MMLASDSVSSFSVERWACSTLPAGLRHTLTEFASRTGPATCAEHYLEERWHLYPEARIYADRAGIEVYSDLLAARA